MKLSFIYEINFTHNFNFWQLSTVQIQIHITGSEFLYTI